MHCLFTRCQKKVHKEWPHWVFIACFAPSDVRCSNFILLWQLGYYLLHRGQMVLCCAGWGFFLLLFCFFWLGWFAFACPFKTEPSLRIYTDSSDCSPLSYEETFLSWEEWSLSGRPPTPTPRSGKRAHTEPFNETGEKRLQRPFTKNHQISTQRGRKVWSDGLG